MESELSRKKYTDHRSIDRNWKANGCGQVKSNELSDDRQLTTEDLEHFYRPSGGMADATDLKSVEG